VEKRKEGKGTPMEKREGKTGLDSAAACGGKKCSKRIRGREIAEKKDNWDFSKGVYAKSENCRGLFVKQNFPLI
jgi:hypothetical protein